MPDSLPGILLKGTYLIFTTVLQGRYCPHTHFTVGRVGEGMLVGRQRTEQPCIVRNCSFLYAPLDAYAEKKKASVYNHQKYNDHINEGRVLFLLTGEKSSPFHKNQQAATLLKAFGSLNPYTYIHLCL